MSETEEGSAMRSSGQVQRGVTRSAAAARQPGVEMNEM